MKRFLFKKIPFYFFAISAGLLCIVIYQLFLSYEAKRKSPQVSSVSVPSVSGDVHQVRLRESDFTSPLLFTEPVNESVSLMGIKEAIADEINKLKAEGIINDASVYIRKMNDGEWTAVNNSSKYTPGNILRIVSMMTYLKMSEMDPSLMKKEFVFRGPAKDQSPSSNFKKMVRGQKYHARDILYRAIVYSDLDAAAILNENIDRKVYNKLFNDLNIKEPGSDRNYQMNASSLSRFMNILYNSTYLTPENSEMALSLLVEGTFSEGIMSGVPPGLKVANKFGEIGTGDEAQLHETAIVYLNNDPYLLTIMTRGASIKKLPDVLSSLSRMVYSKMKG